MVKEIEFSMLLARSRMFTVISCHLLDHHFLALAFHSKMKRFSTRTIQMTKQKNGSFQKSSVAEKENSFSNQWKVHDMTSSEVAVIINTQSN